MFCIKGKRTISPEYGTFSFYIGTLCFFDPSALYLQFLCQRLYRQTIYRIQ